MTEIGMDIYLNTIIIASCETLSYVVTGRLKLLNTIYIDFAIPHIKRKKTLFIGFLICSIILLIFFLLKLPSDCGEICTVSII